MKVYIGYDPRQPIAYTVLNHSIISQASKPISIAPLIIEQLPIQRTGLTTFTFSRFLVPYLCNYTGWAVFLDADMLLLDDIAKLFALANDQYAVMVVKNEMRFEWSSVMLFNCAKCRILTPEYIEQAEGLHGLAWCAEEQIGALPSEWNHLVGYDPERPDAKLVHYTQGIPAFPELEGCEYYDEWFTQMQACSHIIPWVNIMGNSVHVEVINNQIVPKLVAKRLREKSQC